MLGFIIGGLVVFAGCVVVGFLLAFLRILVVPVLFILVAAVGLFYGYAEFIDEDTAVNIKTQKVETTGGDLTVAVQSQSSGAGVRIIAEVTNQGNRVYTRVTIRCAYNTMGNKEATLDLGDGLMPNNHTIQDVTGTPLFPSINCAPVAAIYRQITPLPGVAVTLNHNQQEPSFTVSNGLPFVFGHPSVLCHYQDPDRALRSVSFSLTPEPLSPGLTERRTGRNYPSEFIVAYRQGWPMACQMQRFTVKKSDYNGYTGWPS